MALASLLLGLASANGPGAVAVPRHTTQKAAKNEYDDAIILT